MKPTNILFFLLLCVLLSGCKDNDIEDTDRTLDAESLKQTSWSGTMIDSYNRGDKIVKSDIGIIFYTNKNGKYDIITETDSGDINSYIDDFEYFVDGMMLFIKGNIYLKGYWLVIEKSKNKMVLEQSTGVGYKATLVLNRSH